MVEPDAFTPLLRRILEPNEPPLNVTELRLAREHDDPPGLDL
jgi:hypothetical protein